MDIIFLFKAFIMGIVEGLTEFLPISSTGHLILVSNILNFTNPIFSMEKINIFEIVIQIGAILAVCWKYRVCISIVLANIFRDHKAQQLILNLIIALLPVSIIGLLFGNQIKEFLFFPIPVAIAFIFGGIIIVVLEHYNKQYKIFTGIKTVHDLIPLDAFKIGCIQVLSLIPGISRSAVTIIGGMFFSSLSRKAAIEFSFFLAIPTIFSAASYSLYKTQMLLHFFDISLFFIGIIAAFISAVLSINWLLRYIIQHNFTIFGLYRILLGLLILCYL